MGQTLNVGLGERSYDIIIQPDSLKRCADYIAPLKLGTRCVIITNPTVAQWYCRPVMESLQGAGYQTSVITVPDGETTKSMKWLEHCYHEMLKARCGRQSFVAALGGGVIGDLAGYAAATFMRGVPFVQIPTTLLAQVDSSVGGKTGINLPEGKNLIGAFYQPRLVLIDPVVLNTLPARELRAGFAEVIKYGIIHDSAFFDYLENAAPDIFSLNPDAVEKIISTSCRIKAWVVEQDERESALRAILNFGHTTAHALEALTQYGELVHGEAVAIGMMVACSIGERLTGFTAAQTVRVKQLITAANLPYRIDSALSDNRLIEVMYHDKKAGENSLNFVLPESIGTVKIVQGVKEDAIRQALSKNRV